MAHPAAGTLGNCPVSSERGPGLKNVDFALSKFFPITERQSLEFRAEAINAFNTPILLVQGYVTDVLRRQQFRRDQHFGGRAKSSIRTEVSILRTPRIRESEFRIQNTRRREHTNTAS